MLNSNGKPATFGPGLFKREGSKGNDFNSRWENALEDTRRIARTERQLAELERLRRLEFAKKAAGSPLEQLAAKGGGQILNALFSKGGDYLSNKLFGGGDTVGSGSGFFSNLFGGGNSATSASNLTAPGEVPSFMSGYTGGYPGPINSVGPSAVPEQGGFFSNLFGGGEGATPGASTFASYGIPAAAAATTYLAGKSALNMLHGKSDNSLPGKFGRGSLAVATGGLSELGKYIGGLSDKNAWDTERERLQALKDQGYIVPENLLNNSPTQGRSVDELINHRYGNDFIGQGSKNEWVNNKFAQSRQVSDLKPEDIVGYSAFAEKNPNWFNTPLEKRLEVAKYALDNGLVDENHGTIDLGNSSDFENYLRQILGK